ncbi:MAG: hypothetical protein IH598_07040 [Bacteroidales bacterium]|nr:hypothetical protein [Bacteroidales bacterium]
MTQEIITYLILLVTIIVTVNKVMSAFKTESGGCNGCSSHENGCKIAAIKQHQKNKQSFG